MAQTAVEWLISEIQRHNDSGYEFHPKYNEEIIQQAKEMEKQQIMEALFTNDFDYESGENYYKQTFKSE
jgi:predicted alpha/beta-fold hydrolase